MAIDADIKERVDFEAQVIGIEKLVSEIHKANAETRKVSRETWWMPVTFVVSIMTATGGLIAATLTFAKFVLGWVG